MAEHVFLVMLYVSTSDCPAETGFGLAETPVQTIEGAPSGVHVELWFDVVV